MGSLVSGQLAGFSLAGTWPTEWVSMNEAESPGGPGLVMARCKARECQSFLVLPSGLNQGCGRLLQIMFLESQFIASAFLPITVPLCLVLEVPS